MWDKRSEFDRATVQKLLTPVTIQEFGERYYERAPLHVARNCSGYYDEYFTLLEAEKLLYSSSLRTADLRIVNDGTPARVQSYAVEDAATATKKKLPGQVLPTDRIDPDRASALFAAGCSILFEGIQKHVPSLAALAHGLELLFECNAQANVYLTPGGAKGFSVHYDTHDTFIIQIQGSKRWRVYDSPIELPLESQGFDRKRHPVGDSCMDMDLNPGDMLYIPRGFLHEARANDELSLHVTLGIFPALWLHAIKNQLQQSALLEPLMRKTGDGADAAQLSDLLAQAFTAQNLSAALARVQTKWIADRRNGLEGQLSQLARLKDLNEGSWVMRRQNLKYLIEETDRGINLVFSGKSLSLADSAKGIIVAIDSTPVRLGELLEVDADAHSVVRKLIQEGFAVQTDPRPESITAQHEDIVHLAQVTVADSAPPSDDSSSEVPGSVFLSKK